MPDSSNPDFAAHLKLFQKKISNARRQAGRLQKDLATALALDPEVLSRKLHASGRDHLTHSEVKQIIKVLAAWDAITTQAQALELLQLMWLKRESFSEQEWASLPLSRLEKMPAGASVFSSSASWKQTSMPTPLTSLIGRQREIKQVCELLRQPYVRLLTLLGSPGVGKTRLSLAVADALTNEFPDGIYFVSLQDLREADMVLPTIAHRLDLMEPIHSPSVQHIRQEYMHILRAYLHDKQILLVLDNFEHLLDAAVFIEALLEASPQLKVLVTSRAALHLYGEHEFEVPPLEVAEPEPLMNVSVLKQTAAIQLFAQRAQAVNRAFALTQQNAAAVTQLCLRLDGLPLAIELAAARCRLLSPQTLLKRIEGDGVGRQTGQSLMLLHRETPSGPTRQQTLLQTLDWSYQLLDTQTQRLFARLGIFVGGWTLEAAQVICQQQDAQSSADELFDQMERLSSQSLVVSLPPEVDVLDEEPPQRFRFLEPIREYALKRLKESSEWQAVRQRHMQYYLSLAEAIEPDMVGGQRRRAVQQLLREQNNLRAALSWSLEQGQADVAQRLCSAMALFWESRSQFQEAQRWIDAALHMKQQTPVPTRAKLVLAASRLANWKAALEQSRHLAHEAASLYEACGDTIGRARALFQVGDTWYLQGKYEQASDYFEQCLQLQQNGGEQRDYYFTLGRLGAVWTLQGNFAQAEDCLTAALTFFRASDEQWGLTSLLVLLGVLYLVQGKHHQALDMLREGMVLAQTVGQHFNIAIALSSIGCTVGFMGNVSIAARICSAAEALYERLGSSIPTAYLPLYTQYLTMMKTQVDEQTWQTCWAQGRGLSTEQVITLVLEECQQLLRK